MSKARLCLTGLDLIGMLRQSMQLVSAAYYESVQDR
jgi:hypothetical protein